MSEGSRVAALDGLRGVAVAAVVGSHLVERPASAGSFADVVALALDSGWWGVDLFFALSGYLITGILLDGRGEPGAMRSFFGRRALRIWPMSLVTMAVLFVVMPSAYPWTTPTTGLVAASLLFAGNLWMALYGWPAVAGFMWSIFIEEQFYFVWPWIVRRLRERTLESTCVGIALFSAVIRAGLLAANEPTAAYVFTLGRLDGLALGALVALASRRLPPQILLAYGRRGLVAGGAGFLVVLWWRGAWDYHDPIAIGLGISAFSLLAAGLVALVVASPEALVARALENRVARWLGHHSYALYLVHRPIIVLVEQSPYAHALSPKAMTVVKVALSCLAAWAAWHLVEKRFLSLKRLVPRRAAPVAITT